MLLKELCHDCLVYFVIKYCQLLFQSNFFIGLLTASIAKKSLLRYGTQ